MSKFSVSVGSLLEEMSVDEYCSERGEGPDDPSCLLRVRWNVAVRNAYGRRWLRPCGFVEAEAERLAERVRARLDAGGKLDSRYWAEGWPVYGSDAYSGAEEEAWERSLER